MLFLGFQVTKGDSHISKLEFWGNKRLNLMERKVDTDVYRLRFNTSSRTELEVGSAGWGTVGACQLACVRAWRRFKRLC